LLLTVVVVDDLIGLLVIIGVLFGIRPVAPLTAAILFYSVAVFIACSTSTAALCIFVIGACAVGSSAESARRPVVTGLAIGLLALAVPAPRRRLEEASARFRAFREQPTAELARAAATQLRAATSPDERLQQLYHPWSSYVIVPVFALANAGFRSAASSWATRSARQSPSESCAVRRRQADRHPQPHLACRTRDARAAAPTGGWAAVGGAGTVAGIGSPSHS